MPYNRLHSLEMLKKEHKFVTTDLQKLSMEISDVLSKCKWLIEEKESLRQVPDLAGRN